LLPPKLEVAELAVPHSGPEQSFGGRRLGPHCTGTLADDWLRVMSWFFGHGSCDGRSPSPCPLPQGEREAT
jgi:hypothetical protein